MEKQDFVKHVKSIYPNMIEEYWFEYGELHFYINELHERLMKPYACIFKNGEFEILKDF